MPDGARWRALLGTPGPILADGAMGTILFEAGLTSGNSPERWNVERPDVIRGIHRAYRAAGSRILLTNTFGGNRFRLALHGLDTRVAEFNEAAARLAAEVAHAPGSRAVVAGDIGPSGGILAPLGDLERADAVKAFAEQAAALRAGGVDVFWIETMSALEEIDAALEGVRQAGPGVPVVITLSFDTHGHTMMGVNPEQAAKELTALGAAAVGGNCGLGPAELLPAMAAMRAFAPDALLVAKPNAGLPVLEDGRAVYRGSPGEMADFACRLTAAGVRIVGGCCGSTPEHLRAMAAALGVNP
ncbi:MAG TPA: homocysteine S-methyltransferase family protein [Methylomirabilota bacterium]|nr:homocysteine S-methyltransferase family protein [Methylomirabilota bacterium]